MVAGGRRVLGGGVVLTMYYQVTLEDGRQLAIFKNMKTGGWYQAA